MSKYPTKRGGDGNPTKREADTATVAKGKSTAERSNKVKKASNKSNQIRAKVLKKVIAQLMSAENDDNDDKENDLLEEDNENGDYDEEEDVAANRYILNLVEEIPSVISEEDPINSKTTAMLTSSDSVKPRNSRYLVDSACRGAHIVKSAHNLNTIADTSAWK